MILKELYNLTKRELEEIKANHIDFYINKDFDLLYNLPEDSPIEKLKRLDSFQKDAVLNFKIREKYDIDLTTNLPEKENT